jgi:small-conductance mechanosensitive channel
MPEWWVDLNPWLKSGVVVFGTFFVAALFRKIILVRLERFVASTDNDLDDRLVQFFKTFFFLVVFFLALIWVLSIHGVRISPLLAGAGIAGIAVGLAAKETLADVLAGIFLIVDRPMRVGDRVKIEHIGRDWGGWGDVIDVGMRRTIVRNTDGVIVNYPNNVLANSVITNFSHETNPVRVRIRFQVDYDADLAETTRITETAIERSEGVIAGTAQVVVRSLWDDSRGHLLAGVLLEGRYRIQEVRDRTRIRSTVLKNVIEDLLKGGVPLPAPRVRVNS